MRILILFLTVTYYFTHPAQAQVNTQPQESNHYFIYMTPKTHNTTQRPHTQPQALRSYPQRPAVQLPQQRVAAIKQYQFKSWMSDYADIIRNQQINNVVMPGSHDSATYSFTGGSQIAPNDSISHKLNNLKFLFGIKFGVNAIIAKWSKTQNHNIYTQLMNGIRYLDLRFSYRESKKTHFSVHGLYGESVDKIFNDIRKFIDENPKEIIILHIGGFSYMNAKKKGDTHPKLIQKIKDKFADKLVPEELTAITTVGRIWELGKQIILIYSHLPSAQINDGIWTQAALKSKWPNLRDSSKLFIHLNNEINNRNQNALFVLPCVMTPDIDSIKQSLKPSRQPKPKSLKDYANTIKAHMPNWLNAWKNRPLNIITSDFMEDPRIIGQIIQMNLLNVKNK